MELNLLDIAPVVAGIFMLAFLYQIYIKKEQEYWEVFMYAYGLTASISLLRVYVMEIPKTIDLFFLLIYIIFTTRFTVKPMKNVS